MADNEEAGDEDFLMDETPPRPDYSELSIEAMLTRIQRAHIENMLTLVESGEIPNAQVLAQVNRFLADNGFTLNGSVPTIDGTANRLPPPPKDRQALPDFSEERYDE